MPTAQEVTSQFKSMGDGQVPTKKQIDYYTQKPWGVLNGDLLQYVNDRLREARAAKAGVLNKDAVIAYINANLKSS